MNRLLIDRRLLVAGTLGGIAGDAVAQSRPIEVDIAIIGAGAAGIAAARKLGPSKRSILLLDARNRVGGRCTTDAAVFGQPVDLGARWMHNAPRHPVIAASAGQGLTFYDAPDYERLVVSGRPARESDLEDFAASRSQQTRAIAEAATGTMDRALAQVMPDAGPWRPTMDFLFGPYDCGKDVSDISLLDFAQAEEGPEQFCREGFGSALSRLAEGLPLRLGTEVTGIDWSRRPVTLKTNSGTISAKAVIVTASTSVLLSPLIRFTPELPRRTREALQNLSCGTYEHIIFEVPKNPLNFRDDERVIFRANDRRTGGLLARMGGSELYFLDIGGQFAEELVKSGPDATIAFAREFLGRQLGPLFERAITKITATNWKNDPYARGAWSVARPGAHLDRRILAQPFSDRLFLAGEALDSRQWGTVAGAWFSGERAADAALQAVGGPANSAVKPRERRR